MVLAMVHKRGLWEGVWQQAGGASAMEDEAETETERWEEEEREL